MPTEFTVREIRPEDAEWVKQVFLENWGGDFVVSRGRVTKVEDFSGGYVAEQQNKKVGLITYQIIDNELEITGLVSLKEKTGIGSALVKKVVDLAKKQGIKRVCLVTTNDNLNALGFWQKRGFQLVRVYPNAIEATRKLKPSIPVIGENNIPLRDEIELEMIL